MNDQLKPHPAYLVLHNDLKNPPTYTIFINENLLTARKAAMTLAESLYDNVSAFDSKEEVEVYLVETTSPTDQAPKRIAKVLERGVTPATMIKASEGVRLDPFANWRNKALYELQTEYAYYLNNKHTVGLGCFVLWFQLHDEIPRDSVTVLYDATPHALALIYLLNESIGLISSSYVELQIEFTYSSSTPV